MKGEGERNKGEEEGVFNGMGGVIKSQDRQRKRKMRSI